MPISYLHHSVFSHLFAVFERNSGPNNRYFLTDFRVHLKWYFYNYGSVQLGSFCWTAVGSQAAQMLKGQVQLTVKLAVSIWRMKGVMLYVVCCE